MLNLSCNYYQCAVLCFCCTLCAATNLSTIIRAKITVHNQVFLILPCCAASKILHSNVYYLPVHLNVYLIFCCVGREKAIITMPLSPKSSLSPDFCVVFFSCFNLFDVKSLQTHDMQQVIKKHQNFSLCKNTGIHHVEFD